MVLFAVTKFCLCIYMDEFSGLEIECLWNIEFNWEPEVNSNNKKQHVLPPANLHMCTLQFTLNSSLLNFRMLLIFIYNKIRHLIPHFALFKKHNRIFFNTRTTGHSVNWLLFIEFFCFLFLFFSLHEKKIDLLTIRIQFCKCR